MNTGQIATVAASATVVLGGIGALMRVIFKAVLAVRDNTIATANLSGRVDALSIVSRRLDSLDSRLASLEKRF